MSELDDDEACALCLDAPRELRFRPCGHSLMCEHCTLKLIARSANMVAKCPNCTSPIQDIALFRSEPGSEAAWPVSVALPSRVGKDTSQAVSPTRGTYKRSEPTGFSASTDLSVEAFIEEHVQSENATLKNEAAAAKQAWRQRDPQEFLPDAALRLPVPNLLTGRVLATLGSIALLVVWVWALVVANQASLQLEAYLGTHDLQVKVAAIDGVPGPVTALLPLNWTCGGPSNATSDGPVGRAPRLALLHARACADTLADPTAHQRWWGLVPAQQVGAVSSVGGHNKARLFVGVLLVFSETSAVLKALLSAVYNQPRALSELASAGFHTVLHTVLLFSLYGMLYDATHGIVVLNYFPGRAYMWLLLWMLLWLALVVLGFTRNPCTTRFPVSLRLAAAFAFTYWLLWLAIPLLGYAWFFAWGFVDAVIAQGASAAAGGAEGGAEGGAGTAAALPGAIAAARSLERPFAAAVYLGLGCWLAGSAAAAYQSIRHYWHIRTSPTYRQASFAAANITDTGFVGRPFPWTSANTPSAAQADPPAEQTDADAPPASDGASPASGGASSAPAAQPTRAPPTSPTRAYASSAVAADRPAVHGDALAARAVPAAAPRPLAPDTRERLAPLDARDWPALPLRPTAAASSASSAMASSANGSRYASAMAASASASFMPVRNRCQHAAAASRSGAADLV